MRREIGLPVGRERFELPASGLGQSDKLVSTFLVGDGPDSTAMRLALPILDDSCQWLAGLPIADNSADRLGRPGEVFHAVALGFCVRRRSGYLDKLVLDCRTTDM